MNNARLETTIIEACDKLITEFINIVKNGLDSHELPLQTIPYNIMEPSGPGGYSGRECFIEEMDFGEIWHKTEKSVTSCSAWKEATVAIQTLIATKDISLSWPGDVSNLLTQLFNLYLKETGYIEYKKSITHKVIGQMIDQLNAPGFDCIGLIVLNNFKADYPFELEKNIVFRPINVKDIELLVNRSPFSSIHDSANWIYSDCWVCEIKKMNLRGTFDAQNKISEMAHNEIPLVLRMFKQGNARINLGVLKVASAFEGSGISRGGRIEDLSSGSPKYQLSGVEIKGLIKFWRKIQFIIDSKDHYLQIPLRRMRHAGTRIEKADSIIDYVIGLEALLGTKSEQMEIGYRFKVRGSVILAKKRRERLEYISKLATLYKLRSIITHGSHVSNKELEEYIPFAEAALRNIWRWYFNHYPLDSNNEAGINKIDGDLVVK